MVEICTSDLLHNLYTIIIACVALGMSTYVLILNRKTQKIIREAEQLRRDFEQTALHNFPASWTPADYD